MSDTVRAATPADLPEIVALTNRVFRPNGRGDMAAEFPLLLSAANAESLWIVLRGGRIVSHVGVLRHAQVLDGVGVPAACIGAVCTDPEFRGQGLAGAALAGAVDAARARGDVLMPISGQRSLYSRMNALPWGPQHKLVVPRAKLGPAAGEPFNAADADAVIALHEGRPVRYAFRRRQFVPRHDSQVGHGIASWVLRAGGGSRVEAWALVGPAGSFYGPRDGPAVMVDFAGEAQAVAALAAGILDRAGNASLQLWLPWNERAMLDHFRPLADTDEVAFRPSNLVALLNLPGLVERMADRLAPLSPRASASALELTAGAGRLVATDPVSIHHLLFTQPDRWPAEVKLDRAIGTSLAPRLPIPLPPYGLCYV